MSDNADAGNVLPTGRGNPKRYKFDTGPEWDRLVTEAEFRDEVLCVSNSEIDMSRAKPVRVSIHSQEWVVLQ